MFKQIGKMHFNVLFFSKSLNNKIFVIFYKSGRMHYFSCTSLPVLVFTYFSLVMKTLQYKGIKGWHEAFLMTQIINSAACLTYFKSYMETEQDTYLSASKWSILKINYFTLLKCFFLFLHASCDSFLCISAFHYLFSPWRDGNTNS